MNFTQKLKVIMSTFTKFRVGRSARVMFGWAGAFG
jgi:hypothetical protein